MHPNAFQESLCGFKNCHHVDLLKMVASHDFSFPRAALLPSVPGREAACHFGEHSTGGGAGYIRECTAGSSQVNHGPARAGPACCRRMALSVQLWILYQRFHT